MNRSVEMVAEDARNWVLRLQDSAFADWDAFADWLERDPGHLPAYNAALDADEAMAGLFAHAGTAAPEPAQDLEPAAPQRQRLYWISGGAVAAALALVVGWTSLSGPAARHEYATAPGERREVALADGSKMVLNGDTRVALLDKRHAELVQGEALFEVRHDAANPFIVKTGDVVLQDAGTVFNVVRDESGLRVAVAEGAVIYQPGTNAMHLAPGDALSVPAAGTPQLTRTIPSDIGAWRGGQLVYRNATLDRVAADLSRNLGIKVRAGRGTEAIPFTGTISTQGGPGAVIERIAALTGTKATRAGKGWTLDTIDGAPR
ncbi:FecR domain-containing protein [Sphingomonas sp. HITSZ_GF]|uniref:FecR family protein n=1 Tax=Sphingomonas sp. HITSZ_GF TaxID=3037247 RepID=UPI00240DA82A|nr:FecR domain-containing protein [Sphingomonas sp. HITSZ_GF]MDG2534117.1 FecR domain-containing protein [Sphingomonas sp. HITSZ_GF]